MDILPADDLYEVPLSGKFQSKKDLVNAQKAHRLDTLTIQQTEAAAKLAFEMEEFNSSSISEVDIVIFILCLALLFFQL